MRPQKQTSAPKAHATTAKGISPAGRENVTVNLKTMALTLELSAAQVALKTVTADSVSNPNDAAIVDALPEEQKRLLSHTKQ